MQDGRRENDTQFEEQGTNAVNEGGREGRETKMEVGKRKRGDAEEWDCRGV